MGKFRFSSFRVWSSALFSLLLVLSCHSPASMNPYEAASGKPLQVTVPVPSVLGGTYAAALTSVTLSSSTNGAEIRYTLDGSAPEVGTVYTGPFSILKSGTVLRAVATKSGFPISGEFGGTYQFTDDLITSFSLVSPVSAPGVITGSAIALTVPNGTNLSSMVAAFASAGTLTVGGVTQVSGSTANSFASPVTYQVTGASGSWTQYTVTVSTATAPPAWILALASQMTNSSISGNLTGSYSTPFTVTTDGAQLHPGAIILYKTRNGHYGQFTVTSRGGSDGGYTSTNYNLGLFIQYTTYNTDGSILVQSGAASYPVMGTFYGDLEGTPALPNLTTLNPQPAGQLTSTVYTSADFFWDITSPTVMTLAPMNGALFYIYQ